MKYKTFLLALILMNLNCGVSKLQKERVTRIQRTSTLIFTPESEQKYVGADLLVTMIPIDALTLNEETFVNSRNDGNYVKKFNIEYVAREFEKMNQSFLGSSEEWELKKEIISYLHSLTESNALEGEIYRELASKIIYPEFGRTGLEADITIEYPNIFNPYRIGNKYLSVFRLKIENNSSSLQQLRIEDIIVNAGYEQLYPFKTEYFEKKSIENDLQLENLVRMNFPDKLVIPPGQTLVKYLSIPSLDYEANKLKISFLGKENQIVEFDFAYKPVVSEQKITLQPYQFKSKKYFSKILYQSFVLTNGRNTWALDNDKFFVDEGDNSPYSVYGILSLNGGYSFGKLEDFRYSDFPKYQIEVPFQNMRKYGK